jgi:heat shock protein HtpX
LPRNQLTGVIAHELAHICNRDTLIMTITATLAGTIAALANWGWLFGGRRDNGHGAGTTLLMSLLAPLAAMLVQTAVSRSREFEADRLGAEICGNPLDLAQALAALERESAMPNEQAEAHPATAHLYIVNPLAGSLRSLFATHPPTEQRIAALYKLAESMGQSRPPASAWSPFKQSQSGSFLGGYGLPGSGSVEQYGSGREGSAGPWG